MIARLRRANRIARLVAEVVRTAREAAAAEDEAVRLGLLHHDDHDCRLCAVEKPSHDAALREWLDLKAAFRRAA